MNRLTIWSIKLRSHAKGLENLAFVKGILESAIYFLKIPYTLDHKPLRPSSCTIRIKKIFLFYLQKKKIAYAILSIDDSSPLLSISISYSNNPSFYLIPFLFQY